MAMTFASYAAPSFARPMAVAAVVALTAINYLGVKKTALLTRVIVAAVLAALTQSPLAVILAAQGSLAAWTLRYRVHAFAFT
jgi:basic amino acid/polyamine antiporter, APA family